MKNTFRFILMLMLPLAIDAAPIPGQRVTGPIVPSDTADTYPTHFDQYGAGGYRSVADEIAKEAIPTARRSAGMMVHVRSNGAVYILGTNLTTWQSTSISTNDFSTSIAEMARKFDEMADIANLTPLADGEIILVANYSDDVKWSTIRTFRYELGSVLAEKDGCVVLEDNGRWIADDCSSGNVKPEWHGGFPNPTVGGYTNRLTWQGIIVDSREAVQQAIDDVSERGGGIVELGPGEWRFGDETNAGTIYLKPNVRLRGAGMPTVENAFSGTFSMTNIAGRITATMLHFSGGLTNGYGAPCVALVGTPYYTNQYSSWFYDANTEVVWYRSGGNEISDLGIWSGWKWAWSGTNPPGAAIYINEVSEVAINRVFIGPTAGPGIYRRGAFGNKISGSYIASTLSPGIVTVDTSDTVISDSTIVASSGSAMTFTGELRTNGTFQNTANTHRMYGLEVWNNNTELVGWRDAGQTTTNWTTIENSDTRRDGYSADASTDLIGNPFRIGADTGMPVFVGGTDLPGGLSTNVPYYVRWGTAGGTNFYLCNTAGRSLNGGAVVDITSAGGTNWFLYAPQAIIHAHGSEEIQIDGMRADQSWAGILDLTKAPRVLVNGLHSWELGYNQIARDRRQTWYDPNIVAVRLRDVNTFVMSGSMISGSKGNSGVGVPWIHNSFGVVAHGLRDGNISGNLFDRVDTGILLDDQSGNVGIDPGQFGSWVSRPVVAPSGLYGVTPNNPYWDANGSAQIVAPITSGYTNVTGDWSVAIKVRVPDQPTNSFLYHNAVFNLSSVTNADFASTNYNALVVRSVVYSFYRSVTDSSMNFAGLHIGTNYPGVAGVDDKRFNMDVTPFIGKDVEIVVQRSNNWQQLWLNGEKRSEFPLSDWISTGVVYAPFFIVGQLKNSTNLSHLTTPLYGIAYHHRGFSDDEINSGLPWAGTNAVLLYDFRGDSVAGGVLDKSGRGNNGSVQQTGPTTPEFGPTDDVMIIAGANTQIDRLGRKTWMITSLGSGVTNPGTPVSVDGIFPGTLNLADSPKISVTQFGSNGTFNVVSGSLDLTDLTSAAAASLRDRTTHTGITPIAGGGTGATNTAGALSNLGAQAASAELAALAANIATGILARIGTSNYVARTLTAGSTNLTVANGNGASGNPTVDIVTSNLFKAVLNSGVPNGTGAFVDWSQLKNVPAGFADGTDDGSSSLYPTNGASPGWFLVIQPDMAPRFTNVLAATSMALSGDLVVGGSLILSNPIALTYLAPEVLSETEAELLYQPLDPQDDLTAIGGLSGTGLVRRLGDGSFAIITFPGDTNGFLRADGTFATPPGTGGGGTNDFISSTSSDFQVASGVLSLTNTSGSGAVLRQSAALSWDIDTRFSITNTAGAMETVYSEAVPDGQTRSVDLQILMAGATNGYQGSLFGRLSNRGGTPMLYTTNGPSGTTAADTLAFVTNSGTNLVVLARGPSYQPFNGHLRGTRQIVTNAGAYSSTPTLDTNGLRLVWRLDEATNGTRTSDDAYALQVTATNTVNFISSGVRSNAARFSRASSQSLGMATTNLVEVTNENFSVVAWANPSSWLSSGQIAGLVTKVDPGVNARVEWSLHARYNDSNKIQFEFTTGTNGAGAGTHTIVSTTLATSTNAWYMIAGGRDAALGSNWISVNGSAKEWVASPIPGPTITPFRIGLYGSATHFWNGLIDEVTFWRTNLTMTQINFMTNQPPPTLP